VIGLALMALLAAAVIATTMLRGAANDVADPRSGAPAVRDVSAQRHAESRKCSTYRARHVARLKRTRCWRPYAAGSPFNLRVPSDAPSARGSASVVARMTGWGPPQDLLIGHADTPSDYFHPLYWASRNDPEFRVRCPALPSLRDRGPGRTHP
jgi:hypothetical protein